MPNIYKVGLLGGGVIGAGWAARLLINGIDVIVYDPHDQVEKRFATVLANALRAYHKLTLAPVRQQGTIHFTQSIEQAVIDVDFIQESAPEILELKQKILAQASELTSSNIIIASSSSGLLPTDLQSVCRHPQRVCIGHPFNPVYLLPLVEIVGGKQTLDQTKQTAAALYSSIGMHPLIVRKEVDAFIADRLMESLWREALHLVNEGVATTSEIDQAICYGPGLRWSFMGSYLTYRLAGGETGMKHFLHQFGPTLKLPWARFDGPQLSEELIETIVTQSDHQANGKSIQELETLRDDCLIAVLQGLRSQNYAAGALYRQYEETLYEAAHNRIMQTDDDLSAPLHLHQDQVRPDWVDYNNHLTESRYLQVFGDSSDALFRYIGIDSAYHKKGFSYYTVQTHINHLNEVEVNVPLHSTTQLLDVDEKRIHLFHRLYRSDKEILLATAEMMLLHVNTQAIKACPVKPEIQQHLNIIMRSHRALAKPEQAGRAIGIPT